MQNMQKKLLEKKQINKTKKKGNMDIELPTQIQIGIRNPNLLPA